MKMTPKSLGTTTYTEIPISQLVGSFNRTNADSPYIKQIIDDIRANGVLKPVRVVPLTDDQYRIIDGNKRVHAAIKVGLEIVPCVIETSLAAPTTTFVTSQDGKHALYIDDRLAVVYTDNPSEMIQDTLDVLAKAEVVCNRSSKVIDFPKHIRQFPVAL